MESVAIVSAALDPVLAPRGFPYSTGHNRVATAGDDASRNEGSALFHCEGSDHVAAVMRRYPGWSSRLRSSYGEQEIICLDLWVHHDDELGRSWDRRSLTRHGYGPHPRDGNGGSSATVGGLAGSERARAGRV
ncbi:hypothetical protein FTX61_14435 [Nitriliruptoraceae bacterium ZYF776]|nr:hypothetical protein [Profundirhabdus halotolerans]